MEFHLIWKEQCRAAESIRERFGTDKALGYLIGEKLLNFVREAEASPLFAAELPCFVAEVKQLFTVEELHSYFVPLERIGAPAHVLDDRAYQEMRDAGAFGDDDPVAGAEDVLRVWRMRELLLAV